MKKDTSIQNWLKLSAYLDGELPDKERSDLEKRLERDAILREELVSLKEMKTILRNAPRKKVPRNFTITPDMVRSRTFPVFLPVFSTMSVLSAILFALIFVTQLMPVTFTAPLSNSVVSQENSEPEMMKVPNLAAQSSGGMVESDSTTDEEFEMANKLNDNEMPLEEAGVSADIPQDGGTGIDDTQSEPVVEKSIVQAEVIEEEVTSTDDMMESPPSGTLVEAEEVAGSGPVQGSPIPTEFSSQEDMQEYSSEEVEMATSAEEPAKKEVTQTAVPNIMRNTFSLTQTETAQLQTPEAKESTNRNIQHVLLLEITTALVALVSGWAAYRTWKHR